MLERKYVLLKAVEGDFCESAERPYMHFFWGFEFFLMSTRVSLSNFLI